MTGKAGPVKLAKKGEEYSCFLWCIKELSTRERGKKKAAFPQVQVGTNKSGIIKSVNNQPKNRLLQEGL